MQSEVTLTPVIISELNPPLKITRIRSIEDLEILRDFFSRCNGWFGWDVETTPLKDFFYRRMRTMQFGNNEEQYVIDLRDFCDGDPELLRECQGHYGANLHLAPKMQALIAFLTPYLCSSDYLKIGVNLSFEYMCHYWLFGMRTFGFYDCAIVEKCVWAGAHALKHYDYYSMEEMMARYYRVKIDKKYQESFTLEADLIDDQFAYAALDTRFPIALKRCQELIIKGLTYKQLVQMGKHNAAKKLEFVDPLVTGDNLEAVVEIENNAIGSFEDMHIHGERLDIDRWMKRVNKEKEEFNKLLFEELDPLFIPLVGRKTDIITDDQIEEAASKWKAYNELSDEELALRAEIRQCKKINPELATELSAKMDALAQKRKEKKEELKKQASELGKHRTKIKNLANECEGNALINYSSDKQLLKIINTLPGLKKITNLDDETLEKHEHIPIMAAIRKYHGLSKSLSTYGEAWALQWKTKPCNEEGWRHPGDGRIHSVFNQYEAETGRTSSEKPNGQNLPQDAEIRSCFIADPPNEKIRISTCCEADTYKSGGQADPMLEYYCSACNKHCTFEETHAEEYVILTADMSGAELRIIAELANDSIWINAFARGEDVHSVGTELLYGEKWTEKQYTGQLLKDKKTGEMKPYWCEYYKLHTEETVAKNPLCKVGEPMRQKCECPEHKEMRDGNKSTNFLLAYGGGPATLAARIKKAIEVASQLMALHESKFPRIWKYLAQSGSQAKMLKKSFDMFGRRRIFPEPTWDKARDKARNDREKKLKLEDAVAENNVRVFTEMHGRKPNKEELRLLTHREPNQKEIANAFAALHGNIERQGKNHPIQGTNASIAKKAMGSGYCPAGKPYLWHTLPTFRAKMLKMVHDELVIQCPKHKAKAVAALVGDAFKRAAAERMKKVIMEFDFNIAAFWKK